MPFFREFICTFVVSLFRQPFSSASAVSPQDVREIIGRAGDDKERWKNRTEERRSDEMQVQGTSRDKQERSVARICCAFARGSALLIFCAGHRRFSPFRDCCLVRSFSRPQLLQVSLSFFLFFSSVPRAFVLRLHAPSFL